MGRHVKFSTQKKIPCKSHRKFNPEIYGAKPKHKYNKCNERLNFKNLDINHTPPNKTNKKNTQSPGQLRSGEIISDIKTFSGLKGTPPKYNLNEEHSYGNDVLISNITSNGKSISKSPIIKGKGRSTKRIIIPNQAKTETSLPFTYESLPARLPHYLKNILNHHTKYDNFYKLGVISIAVYIKNSNELILLFSSSRGNTDCLEKLTKNKPLIKELMNTIKEGLKHITFVKESYSNVARIHEDFSHKFFENIIIKYAINPSSKKTNLLNEMKQRVQNQLSSFKDPDIFRILEFMNLLDGVYDPKLPISQKSIDEMKQKGSNALKKALNDTLQRKASSMHRKLSEKDTISIENIKHGLYLYSHNPLCAEKNIFYQEHKFDSTTIKQVLNYSFAFDFTDRDGFINKEMCASCKFCEIVSHSP